MPQDPAEMTPETGIGGVAKNLVGRVPQVMQRAYEEWFPPKQSDEAKAYDLNPEPSLQKPAFDPVDIASGIGAGGIAGRGLMAAGRAALGQAEQQADPFGGLTRVAGAVPKLARKVAGGVAGAAQKGLSAASKVAKPAFSGKGVVADEPTRALYNAWVEAGRPPSYELGNLFTPRTFNPQTGAPISEAPARPIVESTIRKLGQADPRWSILARTERPVEIRVGSGLPAMFDARGMYVPPGSALNPSTNPIAHTSPQFNPAMDERLLAHEAFLHHFMGDKMRIPTQRTVGRAGEVAPLERTMWHLPEAKGYKGYGSPGAVAEEVPAVAGEAPFMTSAPRPLQDIRQQYIQSSPGLRKAVDKLTSQRVYERTKELRRARKPAAE